MHSVIARHETVPASDGTEIYNPDLVYQGGAVSSDVITLRLAKDAAHNKLGSDIVVPELAVQATGSVFESTAQVEVDGLKVNVTIDTGKMKWEYPEGVIRDDFLDYEGTRRQSALFTYGGELLLRGHDSPLTIARQSMVTPDDKPVFAWFAEMPASIEYVATRYGLIELASFCIQLYQKAKADTPLEYFDKISVPAVETDFTDSLDEIEKANPILESAVQRVQLALDYTGARAMATTEMVLRGAPPPTRRYEFGKHGDVSYWFTGVDDKETTPFAVTHTKPESWLTPSENANFDF